MIICTIKKYFCPLLMYCVVLLFFSCSSGKKITEKKDLNTSSIFNPDSCQALNSAFTGVFIYDPESKNVVHRKNEHQYFIPASNAKILTLYGLLNMPFDSLPALRYSENDSVLYIWGLGDPTVLHPDFPESPVIRFLKDRKHKKIFFSDDNFKMHQYGSGWMWDDYPYYFQPELSSLPLYGNITEIISENGNLEVIPSFFYDSINFSSDGKQSAGRSLHKNEFSIPLQQSPEKSATFYVPFITSGQLTAKLLSEAVGTAVEYHHMNISNANKILFGMPKDTVQRAMMYHSDNLFAEQLLISASSMLSDSLDSAVSLRYFVDNVLPSTSDPIKWKDGSGLSRYNLITPVSIVSVLDTLMKSLPRASLFSYFPANGSTGTLKNSFRSTPSFIFAKTGSMSGVYNLSGYMITNSGKTLIFCLMSNNFNASVADVRKCFEQTLIDLKNNY